MVLEDQAGVDGSLPPDDLDGAEEFDTVEATAPESSLGGDEPAEVQDKPQRPADGHVDDGLNEVRADLAALMVFSQPLNAPPEPAPATEAPETSDASGFEHIIPATAGDVREWIERAAPREAAARADVETETTAFDVALKTSDEPKASDKSTAETAGDVSPTKAEKPADWMVDLLAKARKDNAAQSPPSHRIADAVSAYLNDALNRTGAEKHAGGDRQESQTPQPHERSEGVSGAARANAGADVMSQLVMNATHSASPAAMPGMPAATPEDARLAESIVQTMRLQWFQGGGTAVLNLEPEYLGGVRVALQVEQGVVTATLHADDPKVRAWMSENEPLLRQGLAAQGLSLERFVIAEEQPADAQAKADARRRPRQQQTEQKASSRRRETSTFAVIV